MTSARGKVGFITSSYICLFFFSFLLQCTTDMFVTEEAAKEVEVSYSFTQLFEQIF